MILSGTSEDLLRISDDEKGAGEGGEGEGEPSDGGDPSEGGGDSSGEGDPSGNSAKGAGGHKDTSELAQEILDQMMQATGLGLKDLTDALEQALKDEFKRDVEKGEQIWCPHNGMLDKVNKPPSSPSSLSIATADKNKVRDQVSYLRSNLRTRFLQARTPTTLHGVRKGQGLSERRLVSSFVDLKGNSRPSAPDWQKVKKEECSLACAVVLDESGSMRDLVEYVRQAALAISDSLDSLGSPCLVVGPRNGTDSNGGRDPDISKYHRVAGVIIDIFKDWDEKLANTLGRFGQVRADGSTPLEDGIQFALQELNNRPERHRVVLVITDGMPDNGRVVQRQIRLAEEAGIHVIGVDISRQDCVRQLFKEYVIVDKMSSLSVLLFKALSGIIFPSRVKKVELDGKICIGGF